MASLRQTNFAAGELSPLMWGRSDSGLYRAGLRRLRDFFVSRQGMAVSRPGTRFVALCADSNAPSLLVPFIVSDADGYLLEFNLSGTVRAYRNGTLVWTGTAPFVVGGVRAPGPLQYAQSGDVLLIANRGPLWQLRRTSETSFAFSTYSFSRAAAEWVTVPGGARTTTPVIVDTANLVTPTTNSPLRPWRWWVSVVLRDDAGRTFESEAFEVTEVVNGSGVRSARPTQVAVGTDRPVTLRRSTSGATWAGTRVHEVLGFNYFRGVGDFAGFIGNAVSDLDFVDDGREPDYTLPAPRTSNPFAWTTPSGPKDDRPLSVGFFEDRLAFGGTLLRPASALLSASGDYIGFQKYPVVVPSQPLEFELAVRKRETVRGLAALQRLLLLSDAGVWAIGGAGALTPDSVQARLVSEVGAAWLRPIVMSGELLFVRNRGMGVRLVRQSDNAPELYSSGDVSWHARHLFENVEVGLAPQLPHPGVVVDWTWQEEPDGLAWMVRADGRLISMQWNGETSGFSLHGTGVQWGDRFVTCATVPEGDEDTVYFCVQRGPSFMLERLTSRTRRGTVADDCCVDCAVPFTAAPGSPVVTVAAAGLDGRQVWLCAKDNAPVGPLTVAAGQVDLAAAGLRLPVANNGGNVTGWVGLLYEPELETLDVVSAESRLKQKTVVKVGLEVDQTRGLKAGQYPDKLSPAQLRNVSTAWLPPSAATGLVEVYVQGGWDLGARATLRQTLPLPVTVLGITREVDGGG